MGLLYTPFSILRLKPLIPRLGPAAPPDLSGGQRFDVFSGYSRDLRSCQYFVVDSFSSYGAGYLKWTLRLMLVIIQALKF